MQLIRYSFNYFGLLEALEEEKMGTVSLLAASTLSTLALVTVLFLGGSANGPIFQTF